MIRMRGCPVAFGSTAKVLLHALTLLLYGSQASAAIAPSNCTSTPSSLTCVGFLGGSFQLLGGAALVGAPSNALDLEAGDTRGCAYTPTALSLRAANASRSIAFEAYFRFSFNVDTFDGRRQRGFVFLLAPQIPSCGSFGQSGYGGDVSFVNTVGVEFRAAGGPCVGLVINGNTADDYCAKSDSMTTLPPGAFVPNRIQRAWLSYDGQSKVLQVYVSASETKPSSPQLVSSIDIQGVLGGTSAYLGFTGGTSSAWNVAPEHHLLYELRLSAVAPGQLVAGNFTPPTTHCDIQASSINCTGFGGSTGMAVVAGAYWTPPPDISLDLESLGSFGCSYSPSPISLSRDGSSIAFEASLTFSINADTTAARWSRGFVLFVSQLSGMCGDTTLLGYGSNAAALNSIGVEVRAAPISCIAVVTDGDVAGEYCAFSDATVALNKSINLYTRQRLWLQYSDQDSLLQVFYSPTALKPARPILVASVDAASILGSTSAYLGLSGGSNPAWNIANEHHVAYNLTLKAVAPPAPSTLAVTAPPPRCTYTESSVRCTGFGGSSPLQFVSGAFISGPPLYALDLEKWDHQGCAWTKSTLSLIVDPSSADVAFEASLVFSFNVDTTTRFYRGFAFVLSARGGICGSNTLAGYGGNSAFGSSVGVEFRVSPVSCVGLVTGGSSAGDYCAFTDYSATLPQAYLTTSLYRAWISYSTTSGLLQVYVSATALKPKAPLLVAPLDLLTALGTTDVYVGLTGGSWTSYNVQDEHHAVYSMALQAVSPGPASPGPNVTATPSCQYSSTSISCNGFGGSNHLALISGAYLQAPPLYALDLEFWDHQGCAFSPAPLPLSLDPTSGVQAFEATFSFSFNVDTLTRSNRGFTFLLSSRADACGTGDYAGYGQQSAFARSVGVEFRASTWSCVAVVGGGQSAQDYCGLFTNSTATLQKPFTAYTRYTAWVSYDGASSLLKLWVGTLATKPSTPLLVAPVDVSAFVPDTAYVGFTGGSSSWWNILDEHHVIYTLAFQTVSPGRLVPEPPTPPPAQCTFTGATISCSGFGGPNPMGFVSGAFLSSPPAFALDLEARDSQGAAFSPSVLNLAPPASPTTTAVAGFSATFSFSFNFDVSSGSRGFVFVLSSLCCAVGSQDRAGYGGASAFAASVGIEFRANPTSCIALVSGGNTAGDNCAVSNAAVSLSGAQAFLAYTKYRVWITFSGQAQLLQVFVGKDVAAQPARPQLNATVDVVGILGTTTPYVAFTGGSTSPWNVPKEHHVIYDLSFNGGAPARSFVPPPRQAPPPTQPPPVPMAPPSRAASPPRLPPSTPGGAPIPPSKPVPCLPSAPPAAPSPPAVTCNATGAPQRRVCVCYFV